MSGGDDVEQLTSDLMVLDKKTTETEPKESDELGDIQENTNELLFGVVLSVEVWGRVTDIPTVTF